MFFPVVLPVQFMKGDLPTTAVVITCGEKVQIFRTFIKSFDQLFLHHLALAVPAVHFEHRFNPDWKSNVIWHTLAPNPY